MARRYRKRVAKKSGKKVRKAAKARENNMDDHRMVMKLSGQIIPQQGGNISNLVYTYWSPSSVLLTPQQSMPFVLGAEFQLYRNLYDQYRVNSVTLTIIPRATQTDSTVLAYNSDNKNITQGKGVFYTVEDRDGIAPGNISALKKYASVKQHKITSRVTRTYLVKYGSNNLFFDCQDPSGLQDIARSLGLNGGITVYAESLPELAGIVITAPWADVEVSYNVTFRGKSIVKLTPNVDGSVTVGQPDPDEFETPFWYPSTEDKLHSGAIDLSGNVIG